jgi:molybdate transport system substrate-binding protein
VSRRGRATALALLLALLGACAGGSSAVEEPAVVRVAAASDLRFSLDEIEALLAEARPGVELAVTYGSSGILAQQIGNGAPYDLFLSADERFPRSLVEQDLAGEADVFAYATGRLVVWARHDSPVDPAAGLAALADPAAQRVAIANPDHAPYGSAAVAAMEGAGVLATVEGRLVRGESVSQAADFLASGNAQIGVIARSLAVAAPLRDLGGHVDVPADLHPPLAQSGVVLIGARDPDAARAVAEVLTGESGQAALARAGFDPPAG